VGGSSSGVDVGVLKEHGYGWKFHQLTLAECCTVTGITVLVDLVKVVVVKKKS
jgi:hypothetical protein